MVLYLGERGIFDYLLSLNVNAVFGNTLSNIDRVIISEYSDQAVRLIKEAILVNIPVLGILDGFQSVIKAFDGRCEEIECAEGKQEFAVIDPSASIYGGLETVIKICRGRPVNVLETVMPGELEVITRSEKGEILAVCNLIAPGKQGNIFGLNYYVASELTPDSRKIIKNFMSI